MTRKSIRAGACIVVALGIGFVAGWGTRSVRADHELRQLGLVHQLERIGFSANALRSAQAGHQDRLNNLLWFGISSGLEAAESEVAEGARLPARPALPSLREAVDRAQGVAQQAAKGDLVQRLDVLQGRLSGVR